MKQNLYSLPESWDWRKLGEVATLINGKAYKKHELLSEGPVPVLRVGNFFSNRSWYYSDLELPEDKYCHNGDLLYAWSASFGSKIWDGGKAIYHYHIWKIITSELVEKKYLYYLLEQDSADIKSKGNGIAMMHATKGGMEKRYIPLPPLPEQKKIAEILDAADSLRQKDQQLIEHYNTLSQSLFLDMFGDPVGNPMGWEEVEFVTVGKLDRGKSKHRPRNDPKLLGGDYPLIQTGDVANCGGYIREYRSTYSEFGLSQSRMWDAGTLCITIAANIAKTGILAFDACFPDSVVGFINNNKSNIEYVKFWMSFLQKILEDSAPMAAQKNINLKILRELEIPLPPIELQNKFGERVRLIEEQKQQAQVTLKKSEDLFNSLLQRAFKGELTS